MWFKNIQLFRLPENWGVTAEVLEPRLAARPITACGAFEMGRRGWGEPFKDGRHAISVAGQILVALVTEEKILPNCVVNDLAAFKAEEIEQMQGFKPGRKQMKELKEAALHELLPKAFSKRKRTFAWIDPVNGYLAVDVPSFPRAEEVLEALRDALEELPVKMLRTELSPVSVMTSWLAAGEAAEGFTVDHDCKLSAVTDERASIRYARHSLDGSDVQSHLAAGKLPEMLGLTFDDRVSFILTEKLAIKRITFLDVVKADAEEQAEAADLQQEADFAIMTGELQRVIAELVAALGGEATPDLADQGTATNPYGDGSGRDPLYEQSIQIVASNRKPSISLVQRHLRIGYNRAARLLESMEKDGYVTPMNSSGSRDVTPLGLEQAA